MNSQDKSRTWVAPRLQRKPITPKILAAFEVAVDVDVPERRKRFAS